MNPAEEASRRAMEAMYASIERGENFLLEAGPGAGKTWGLVKALQRLITRGQASMPRGRQKIACITFTNVAKEEIETRTEQNPLVHCDTIHGFSWSMTSGFQKQLREELPLLPGWREKLDEAGVKTIGVVEYLLGHRRVEGQNVAINHDDVLQLTVALLGRKKFRRVLAERFPVILIDEYQDANAGWMAAIRENVFGEGHPQIGLFGDHWQKIYGDGCGRVQHQALREIGLGANFRSCSAIVRCLNRMRPALPQEVKDPDALGSVVIMHTNRWPQPRRGGNHWKGDLPQEAASEAFTRAKVHLTEQGWSWDGDTTKILMLTHRALAAEQGYGTLPGVFAYNDSFTKKENEHVKFLVDILEPACDAFVELTRFGGRFRYAAFLPAFFTECISSNSIGLL
jgi:DNA helicase-2/ATP-dependent DNA helicase PcrA